MQPAPKSNDEVVPPKNRKAARLYVISLILAFGPLALGLLAHVLNENGLVGVEGTLNLFRMAPMHSMFTMPAATIVLIFAVKAMFPRKPERPDRPAGSSRQP